MTNVTLNMDEVILYSGSASGNEYKGILNVTLTSCRIIIEKEKGVFKKEIELLDTISLDDVKVYEGKAQVKQKGASVEIQTIGKNIALSFSGMLEARKFVGQIVNTVTGTTLGERGSNKVKNAFDMIDDTLGLDTRGAIKGIFEQGVKGVLFNGIKKEKTASESERNNNSEDDSK